jgi:hypothetical protein
MKRTAVQCTLVATIAVIALNAGCQDGNRNADQANEVPDSWLGQWNGPEGTFLQLARSGDTYAITIQSLDGPATYEGIAVGDHIEFVRGGKTESIRAGSGKETGMKWLLEKKDCLVIQEGEGFCRD